MYVRANTSTAGLLNLKAAADYLGISTRQLRELCGRQRITHTKMGRVTWGFRTADLDEYLHRNTIRAKTLRGT
jgi:excisionase family DNA binding protein